MNIKFRAVYYEPEALQYPLGKFLQSKYGGLPWTEIQSHNNIPLFRASENKEFPHLKQNLIVGLRKTHKYTENHKVSDYLVPYTSSGCSAMCLYCYLVCNYNKCAYLRVFVNREEMMERLMRKANTSDRPLTFEIGSNSDLLLENTVTNNLPWTIETFAGAAEGFLTFPTKFDFVEPLLQLDHRQKTIFRMSVNPDYVIQHVELGTSPLMARIRAVNAMCEAGYPVGILLAPVILLPDWERLYTELIELLKENLSDKVKSTAFIEVIFMTYSFVQNAINTDAFPNAVPFYQSQQMTGRGKGKYCYREPLRSQAEAVLRGLLSQHLKDMPILYIV